MSYQKLLLIDPKNIPAIWIDIKPLIDKALKHSSGEMNSKDVLTSLLKSYEDLWVGFQDDEISCMGVTEIIEYPRKTILRVLLFATKTGHDFNIWQSYISDVEKFAVKAGCSSIEAWVRKGFAKKLNWDNHYSVISKQIPSQYGD